MDNGMRKKLLDRRAALQQRLEAEAFLESDIKPFLEILEALKANGASCKIVQLMPVKPEWHAYVSDALQQSPYVEYGFDVSHLYEQGMQELLNTLWDHYPSTNDFRYVPDLPRVLNYDALPVEGLIRAGLKKSAAALALPDQKVYLRYLRYAPVVEMSLYDLMACKDEETLFNMWHGDAVIFPADLNWIIAFTLEEEWYAGGRNLDQSVKNKK